MAINFTSYDNGQLLLIGGQASLGGAVAGNIGPMPRYSINREDVKTGDGTYINSKFTINITGTATLSTYNTNDLQTKGQRQQSIQGLALTNLKFNKQSKMFGNGKLEISPYGGMPNSIVFNDAKLISLDLPEQNEESAGVQYLEYNFVFEAYEDGSLSQNANWGLTLAQPDYKLLSTEESWDLQPNDQFVFKDRAINDKTKQYKTFTLTHKISATGLKKFTNGQIDPNDGHAWRQAAAWVKSRLDQTDNPDAAITKDLLGNSTEVNKNFHPFYLNQNTDTNIFDLKTEPYKARNKKRVINSDIANGSYTVTDSWLVSLDQINAIHEIDVSIDSSIDSASINITVNGTVTGLNTLDVNNNYHNKYINALSEYQAFFTGAANLLATKIGLTAQDIYSDYSATSNKTGSLLTTPINHTESHDKTNGIITWSFVFSDENVGGYTGAISSSLKVTYENDRQNRVSYRHKMPSVIDVVRNGPQIYIPGTTTEKKCKVDVELKMGPLYRNTKPNGKTISGIKPSMSHTLEPPSITSFTESWNPKTGQYTMNIEYTYV